MLCQLITVNHWPNSHLLKFSIKKDYHVKEKITGINEFKPFEFILDKVKGYHHWSGRVEPSEPNPSGKPPRNIQSDFMVMEKRVTYQRRKSHPVTRNASTVREL